MLVAYGDPALIFTIPLYDIFVPDVVHCVPPPLIIFKLPLLSILNCAALYFNDIVFDVFKKGFEKVKFACFVPNAVFIVFNEPST